MKINTDGLIIKKGSVGENDRLVTVLTRDLGVIRAFVHGANKVKGKTVSATDALCYSADTQLPLPADEAVASPDAD